MEIRIYAWGDPDGAVSQWHDVWQNDGVQLFGTTALADAAVLIGPGDGENNVGVDTILEWGPSPNHELNGYEVFFGTEPNELNPGFDMGSPVYSGLDESFDPDKPGTAQADLEWETTYYWRVDYYGPNAPGPDILWVGLLWSFTTVPPIPLIIQSPASTTVPAGTDASLTVETRNAERYEWYKVGRPDQLIVAVDSTAETDTLTISGTPAVPAQLPLTIGGRGLGDRITATLDDIQVYSYALSSVDVARLYTDIAGGTICVQDDDSLPSLQWDFSGNCRVDLADLALFAADWQNCREVPTCLP